MKGMLITSLMANIFIGSFTFLRDIMNIDEGDADYKFDVQYFHRLSGDDVHIKVDHSVLKFKSKERKKFELQVESRPRPWTHVSAKIKWIPIGESTGTRCLVKSPLLLYVVGLIGKWKPRRMLYICVWSGALYSSCNLGNCVVNSATLGIVR